MKWTQSLLFALSLLVASGPAPQAAAQTCLEPSDGLLAWWTGDGNATDAVSGLHGTPMSGADFSFGVVGDAFRLDGIAGGQDDRVILPRHALDGLADMTFEFWVNTTDANQGGLLSAANGNAGGDNEILMLHTTTGLLLIVKQTGLAAIPVMLNDGAWHHVAFVREADTGRLYVDGALVDTRSYPVGPLDVGPRGLMLGQEQDCLGGCLDPAQALDGFMDEVSVYGRALSTDEVVAVFAAGSAGKCKPPEMPTVEDLVQRVQDLEWDVDTLSGQVTDLQSQMLDVEAQMTDLETRMEGMGSETTPGDHTGHRKPHKRYKRWLKKRGHHHDRDDDDRW